MNNKDLEGIKVCGTELKISQFADDRPTVIFLKDKSILRKALNVFIKKFNVTVYVMHMILPTRDFVNCFL